MSPNIATMDDYGVSRVIQSVQLGQADLIDLSIIKTRLIVLAHQQTAINGLTCRRCGKELYISAMTIADKHVHNVMRLQSLPYWSLSSTISDLRICVDCYETNTP